MNGILLSSSPMKKTSFTKWHSFYPKWYHITKPVEADNCQCFPCLLDLISQITTYRKPCFSLENISPWINNIITIWYQQTPHSSEQVSWQSKINEVTTAGACQSLNFWEQRESSCWNCKVWVNWNYTQRTKIFFFLILARGYVYWL